MARTRRVRTYIEGAEEIIEALEDIGQAAEDILDEAAKEGAKVPYGDAKSNCPYKTGNLQSAIEMEQGKKNPKRASWKVKVDMKKAPYGADVELGTSKQSAKPFLRKSVDSNKNTIANKITNKIKQAIERLS